MYNSWIEKYDEIVEHRTNKEQLIKKQPVIAREYVEKKYIHKEDLKNFIDFLEDTDICLAKTVYSEIREQFLNK